MEPTVTFYGDQTLAKSIMFMYETMISRDAAYAVTEGDIGRVYECVKVSSREYNLKINVTHILN